MSPPEISPPEMSPPEMSPLEPRAFETLRVYQGRVRAYQAHFDRLCSSWHLLCQANDRPIPTQGMKDQIQRGLLDEVERLALSWGDLQSPSSTLHPENQILRLWVSLEGELSVTLRDLDSRYPCKNLSAATLYSPLPLHLPMNAKHDQRDQWDMSAKTLMVDELLLLGEEGEVLESHRSNFWALRRDSMSPLLTRCSEHALQALRGTYWVTPPLDGRCVPGVTRALLIKTLQDLGATVVENPHYFSVSGAHQWCYFASSSLKSLSWINTINTIDQLELSGYRLLLEELDATLRTL